MAAVAENGIGSGDHFIRRNPAEYQRDVRELVEMLSNLNPSAKEFVPSSYSAPLPPVAVKSNGRLNADAPVFDFCRNKVNGSSKDSFSSSDGSAKNQQHRRRRNNYNLGRRRSNDKMPKAKLDDCIRRTIYVSDIDQNVTEEMLATLFGSNCGQVLDCRVCGDPHSVLRFAFIEFADEYGAKAAINLSGAMLGDYPLKVLPSKTAIWPVNTSFLPQSAMEKEMCTRTVYCTNIDKKVTQKDVKNFFQSSCGEVCRLRLLGDHRHTTCIAFVEFLEAESAQAALTCSGSLLGSLPMRVSPSKTPVRPRVPSAASP